MDEENKEKARKEELWKHEAMRMMEWSERG